MTCDDFLREMGDVLDGAAAEQVVDGAAQHVRTCPSCDALMRDLVRIRDEAGRLPTLEPPRDLWAEIADRIGTPVIAIAEREEAARRWSAPRVSWRAALAAAASLVIVTVGVTLAAIRGSSPVSGGSSAGGGSPPHGTPAAYLLAVARTGADSLYDGEVAQLRATIAKRRAALDPATLLVVERNMRIIDSAIVNCRAALAHDPGSRLLTELLTNAYESKIALLRTAAALPAAE